MSGCSLETRNPNVGTNQYRPKTELQPLQKMQSRIDSLGSKSLTRAVEHEAARSYAISELKIVGAHRQGAGTSYRTPVDAKPVAGRGEVLHEVPPRS